MKNYKSGLLVILCGILAAVFIISAISFVENSYINIEENGKTYSEFIPYTSRGEKELEETKIFNDILKDKTRDIVALSVIQNQLETNGEYDGKKKIDICGFANRKDKYYSSRKKVEYYLDDILKWYNYGFDFWKITGSRQELEEYFDSLKANPEVHLQDRSNIDRTIVTFGSNSSNYFEEETDELLILISRYKSVSGLELIDYAGDVSEYRELVEAMLVTGRDIYKNFTTYDSLLKLYKSGNTNMAYCCQLNFDNKIVRYSNLNNMQLNISNDELTEEFVNKKNYLYFNPGKLQLSTNINSIDTIFMKQTTDNYGYMFGDNARIWLSLDEITKNDAFMQLSEIYRNGNRVFPVIAISGVVSLIGFVILIVILTLNAGKYYVNTDAGKEKVFVNRKIDEIPVELVLLIFGVIVTGIYVSYLIFKQIMIDTIMNYISSLYIYLFGTVVGFAATCGLLWVYLIIVRKVKGGLVYNGSITNILVDKTKKSFYYIYDNGNLLIKTWLPFLIFVFFNLVCALMHPIFLIFSGILDAVVGVLVYRHFKIRESIINDIQTICYGDIDHTVNLENIHGENLKLALAVNSIGEGIRHAVESSKRDERLKRDLITNVSHDIRTPLTSIINYVDLIKRENPENKNILNYVDVLERKSYRLKELIDDLVEASKLSSKAVKLEPVKLDLDMLLEQTIVEFEDKFCEKSLRVVWEKKKFMVMADGRGLYRVLENVFNNIYKYAMENTRIYIDTRQEEALVKLEIKNVSEIPLNIGGDELCERFVQGDSSRNREGSGLGLSIALNLMEAMGGGFNVITDGDLFKVIISLKNGN